MKQLPFEEREFDFRAGELLLIDKPLEWTSFDIVNKIRYGIQLKKVGHAGTLDPLATGLLLVCTGKSTKTIEGLQGMDKVYEGTLVLGKTTPSIDLETEFDSEKAFDHITEEQVKQVAQELEGSYEQYPPIYSAIKMNGQRLYKKARKGEPVEIKPRPVRVDLFEITSMTLPEVHFRIKCGKGTYIRSIVRDMGMKLECGAYMSALRRTHIGDFNVEDAYDVQDLIKYVKDNNLQSPQFKG